MIGDHFKTCGYCLRKYHTSDGHLCDKMKQALSTGGQEEALKKADAARKDEPAMRYDGGKPRVDLIDPGFILRLGKHYGKGALKYADHNWKKGMSFSRCYASAQRHMLAFWSGEDEGVETLPDGSTFTYPHTIAAAWNMAALDYYMTTPELREKFDDRHKKDR